MGDLSGENAFQPWPDQNDYGDDYTIDPDEEPPPDDDQSAPPPPLLNINQTHPGDDDDAEIRRARYADLYLPRSALAHLPRGEPLIEDVLDRHVVFVVAGRDQTYKSFIVLDWLCCLATGTTWLGHPVTRTKVLYVVGEGAWGLDDRITAWETHHGVTVDDAWFTVRRAPVNLFKQANAFADLLDHIHAGDYGVVVFDTLQRMSAGADQNSARDAGVIIESLDQVRHATTNGAVGIVAHTDKGDRDTRGSSAFEDDADIVWRTRRDDDDQTVTVTLDKRKDGPDGLTMELRPHVIPGTGSLVLVRPGAMPPIKARPPAHTLEALRLLAGSSVGPDGLASSVLSDGLGLRGRGSVVRVLNYLIDEGYATKTGRTNGARYVITDAGRTRLNRVETDLGQIGSDASSPPNGAHHLTQLSQAADQQEQLSDQSVSDLTQTNGDTPTPPLGGGGVVGQIDNGDLDAAERRHLAKLAAQQDANDRRGDSLCPNCGNHRHSFEHSQQCIGPGGAT